ncbi:MAG: preprotein translocase subunit SecE [Bacteroidetes bacterium CG23_combo_of_CG06-09_8_20_14_all_32_9]|nr:MAG: preprotein translocase subunit SecE [Bacteroidetes bacterium CG23_combo_of_CG06-09_8_20_14_all_32_9]
MNKVKLYLQEAYLELTQKVTWPTWKDLQSSAVVVMVASFIIAIIISLMDLVFSNIMKMIYSMFY